MSAGLDSPCHQLKGGHPASFSPRGPRASRSSAGPHTGHKPGGLTAPDGHSRALTARNQHHGLICEDADGAPPIFLAGAVATVWAIFMAPVPEALMKSEIESAQFLAAVAEPGRVAHRAGAAALGSGTTCGPASREP
jgi:hypothetical protein